MPPGVVRGEAAVLVVSTCDCSSVKNGCLLVLATRGDMLSGMPLLLAGLDCLHEHTRDRPVLLQQALYRIEPAVSLIQVLQPTARSSLVHHDFE